MHKVVNRTEMLTASLELGGSPVDLADYATTGLLMVAIGPKGHGKTNAGLLTAEQLAAQGWVSVLIDPEGELESLYGQAVSGTDQLKVHLAKRDKPIVVISATGPNDFIPYGETILEAADRYRKPIFVMIDEGQLFSAGRRKDLAEATHVVNDMVARGRKRALDLFITAHRYAGSLDRLVFNNKNITLIGCQEDPAAWTMLSAQFRGTGIGFNELNSLQPGEFIMLGRDGLQRIRMPMAEALKPHAPKAVRVKKSLPGNYRDWCRAMADIPDGRLKALSSDVIGLLGKVAGLDKRQMDSGLRALRDELEARK